MLQLLQESIFNGDHISYDNTCFEEETELFIEQETAAAQSIEPAECYICDICNGTATFTTKHSLRQHFRKQHTLFKCPHNECDKSFGFRQNLKRHIDEFHTNSRSRRTSKFPPRSCTICGRKFLKPHYHEAHMRLHNGLDVRFLCKRFYDEYKRFHSNRSRSNVNCATKHSANG